MMVLFQVCKPFDRFRRVIWCAMVAALLVVFTLLGDLFALGTGDIQTKLVMVTLLLMAPTVYLIMLRTFDIGDTIYRWFHRKFAAGRSAA